MPGGNGNIRPEDGRQFTKGNTSAEKWDEVSALKLVQSLLDWMLEEDENIFFDDFLYISCNPKDYPGKIYPDLLAYLSKKFTSFFDLFERCKQIEKIRLKKYASFDKLNAGFVKFLLSAEYGLTEKTKIDHRSEDGSMSPKTIIKWGDKEIEI